MEELNKKLEDLLSSIRIDTLLLLKVIVVLFIVNISFIVYNISFNAKIYFDIKEKINEDKILVIDNNGNQYFKRIGYMTENIVIDFAIISIRNLLQYNYENTFNLEYANKYASQNVYNGVSEKYYNERNQLILEEGNYKIDFLSIDFSEINEKEDYWIITSRLIKTYKGLGVEDIVSNRRITVRVDYKSNIFNNDLGLIISELNEHVMTKEDLELEEEENGN